MMSADLKYKLFIEELQEEVDKRREPPKLLKSSRYRDTILEFVDILRTKGYKYKQIRLRLSAGDGTNERCAWGVFATEKFGWNGFFGLECNLKDWANAGDGERICGVPAQLQRKITKFNDYYRWTFDQIADELERGVSIIQ